MYTSPHTSTRPHMHFNVLSLACLAHQQNCFECMKRWIEFLCGHWLVLLCCLAVLIKSLITLFFNRKGCRAPYPSLQVCAIPTLTVVLRPLLTLFWDPCTFQMQIWSTSPEWKPLLISSATCPCTPNSPLVPHTAWYLWVASSLFPPVWLLTPHLYPFRPGQSSLPSLHSVWSTGRPEALSQPPTPRPGQRVPQPSRW